MRAWPILFLMPLLGCASVPEDEEVVPCPEAVAPAEYGPWRLVDEGWFTYCIPTEWDRSGMREWRWASGRLEWDTRRRMAFVVERRRARDLGPPPPSPPRETREVIAGYVVEIAIFEDPGSHRSQARWSSPRELYFQGGGPTPAAGELVREVYRTVRFP